MKSYPRQPHTTIYHREAPEPSNRLLVFIPGNPGLIDFYTTYLDLVQQLYPSLELLAISQAGFDTTGDYLSKHEWHYYDLEFQINHKFEVIRDFVGDRNVELVFLSHLMGSYLTQRVVKKLLEDEELSKRVSIKFIGLICPTIVDIAQSELGQIFTKLFAYLPIVQIAVVFATLLRWLLPTAVIHAIIDNLVIARPQLKTAPAVESWENSKLATYKIIQSDFIIKQALTLASEELTVIFKHEELNEWFFDLTVTKGIHIWAFFANKDHWVHDSTRDYILANYHDAGNHRLNFEVGNVDSEGLHAITHSFCVDQSVEFAAITSKALANAL